MELVAREEGYEVTITNMTETMNVLGIAGPKSGELMKRASNTDGWKFLDAREVMKIV